MPGCKIMRVTCHWSCAAIPIISLCLTNLSVRGKHSCIYIPIAMESNAPARFIACNNQHCSKKFKFIDFATVHTVVDGPDPRDHFANERNLLTWVRVGMVMCLIGKLGRCYAYTMTTQDTNSFTRVHDIIGFKDTSLCTCSIPTMGR